MEGYNPANLTLDVRKDAIEEKKILLVLRDFRSNSALEITVTKSSKNAGIHITFFITNCIINETEFNLNFFYREPTKKIELSEWDLNNLFSVPFEIVNDGLIEKVHMLNFIK